MRAAEVRDHGRDARSRKGNAPCVRLLVCPVGHRDGFEVLGEIETPDAVVVADLGAVDGLLHEVRAARGLAETHPRSAGLREVAGALVKIRPLVRLPAHPARGSLAVREGTVER